MANVMLNHREQNCCYNPVDMQDTSDDDNEATSHLLERVPPRSGAAADRKIVDVDTLEQKAIDGDTAFVVEGLVIEKVRTDVSIYYVELYCNKRMIVDNHGNLRCGRHACVNVHGSSMGLCC